MYKLLAQQTSTVPLACMISDDHELVDSQVPPGCSLSRPWQYLRRASILCNNWPTHLPRQYLHRRPYNSPLFITSQMIHHLCSLMSSSAAAGRRTAALSRQTSQLPTTVFLAQQLTLRRLHKHKPPAARTAKKNGSSLCCPVCMSTTRRVREAGLRGASAASTGPMVQSSTACCSGS